MYLEKWKTTWTNIIDYRLAEIHLHLLRLPSMAMLSLVSKTDCTLLWTRIAQIGPFCNHFFSAFSCLSSVICWSSEFVCLLSPFHSNVNSVSVQQGIVRGGHETVPMAMSGFSQIRSDLPTTRTTLIQFPFFFCFVNFI